MSQIVHNERAVQECRRPHRLQSIRRGISTCVHVLAFRIDLQAIHLPRDVHAFRSNHTISKNSYRRPWCLRNKCDNPAISAQRLFTNFSQPFDMRSSPTRTWSSLTIGRLDLASMAVIRHLQIPIWPTRDSWFYDTRSSPLSPPRRCPKWGNGSASEQEANNIPVGAPCCRRRKKSKAPPRSVGPGCHLHAHEKHEQLAIASTHFKRTFMSRLA
eukprot:scaffold188368_cov29-Prasinocladus_malaysianus.AAC.2